MSFDTKYRPKTYQDLIGQEPIVKVLKGVIANNKGWCSSYVFSGGYGTGKTTTARILARALLCESPINGEACDKCYSCVSMLEGTSDAYIEVDSATNSGKDDLRKVLDEIDYSTFSGRRRLYCFDEAHALSTQSLDLLLKSLEDNRPNSLEKKLVCIFCTTEIQKLRQTILSRAMSFIIKPATDEQIANRLVYVCDKEGITYDYEALKLIANITEYHIRDALKAVEGISSGFNKHIGMQEVRSYLHIDRNDLLASVLNADARQASELLNKILESTPVGVAYDRLIEACMLSINIGLGLNTTPPYWNSEILKQAWLKNQNHLLKLADELASKPIRATNAMLICDVMKWKMGFKVSVDNIEINNVEEKKVEKLNLPMFISIVKDKIKTK
jgi:DNA polymerase-3 subunit gamma/tau